MAYKNRYCSVCDRQFSPNSPNQHICSDTCRHLHYLFQGKDKWYDNGIFVRNGYKQKGHLNNNYKKGIWTKENNYKHKIKSVCERCGATNLLVVHHKDSDRDNYNDSNLETLCRRCHQNHHTIRDKYGRYKSRKV